MVNTFLKAKHWQLFLLTFGIPLLIQIVVIINMIANIATRSPPNVGMLFLLIKLTPVLMLLFLSIFFGWFWSVSIGLQQKIPENVKMKVKKFKIFFFIPIIYLLIFSIFMFFFFDLMLKSESESMRTFLLGSFVIIIPLHIISILCVFYLMYFTAKTIKTIELQREVTFSEFAGEFFMIWFFPIGIWIIQPKINKIFS